MDVVFNEWVLLLGAVTPFLTAISAKINTPDWWKGLISITWAVVAAILIEIGETSPSDLDLSETFSTGAGVWATHLLTWLGLSRDAARKLHERTAAIGLRAPGG